MPGAAVNSDCLPPTTCSAGLVSGSAPSPVGLLTLVASPAGLVAVLWPDDRPMRVPLGPVEAGAGNNEHISRARNQLADYFNGRLRRFQVALDMRGTTFQREVWAQLAEIPHGETRSYGEIAAAIGRPTGSRAVGAAVGRNPLSIIVPCHRVIGKSGSVTGFAGGLDAKRRLLSLESPKDSTLFERSARDKAAEPTRTEMV